MRLQFPYGVSSKSPTICLLGVARHNGDFPSSFKIYAALWISPEQKIDGFIIKRKKNIDSCKTVFPMLFLICNSTVELLMRTFKLSNVYVL